MKVRQSPPNAASGKLRALIDELGIDPTRATKLLSSGFALRHHFQVSAEDFLQQAEDDFELKGSTALLNGLSNAKRAIHAQIDEVLIALGYKIKGLAFPRKVALFSDFGFVAPRILKRVNDARNILEHEYTMPTFEQVEEAIDLAALFVGAAKRHTEVWDYEFTVGNSGNEVDNESFSEELFVRFEEKEKLFQVIGQKNVLPGMSEEWQRPTRTGEIRISAQELLFPVFVRLVVAGDRERKIREALNSLFDTLQL